MKAVLPDGRKQYGSVYAHSYKEVKEKREQTVAALKMLPADEVPTVEGGYQLWIESCRQRLKPNTYLQYERLYLHHIQPVFGGAAPQAIDRQSAGEFIRHLTGKGLSTASVNNIIMVLNIILKYINSKYGTAVGHIPLLKRDKKSVRYLSIFEQKRLTNYLSTEVNIHKLGVLLTLYTGLRLGELCALQWEDITEDYIVINKTMMRIKSGDGTKIEVASPKSETSKRLVPTPKTLLPLLQQFRSGGYFLSHGSLAYTEPRLMQMKFKAYAQACALDGATFHTLRHTFATRCVEAGVDIKTLSEMLGHCDVNITLNRYVHSSFEQKQNGILQLEKLIS